MSGPSTGAVGVGWPLGVLGVLFGHPDLQHRKELFWVDSCAHKDRECMAGVLVEASSRVCMPLPTCSLAIALSLSQATWDRLCCMVQLIVLGEEVGLN